MEKAYIIFSSICQWLVLTFGSTLLWLLRSQDELDKHANKAVAAFAIFAAVIVWVFYYLTFKRARGR